MGIFSKRNDRKCTKRRGKVHRNKRSQLSFEPLEERQMLAAEDFFPRNDTVSTAFHLGLQWGSDHLAFEQANFDGPSDVDWFHFSTLEPAFGNDRVALDDFWLSTPGAAPLGFRLYFTSLQDGQLYLVPESNRIDTTAEVPGAQTSYYFIGGLPATDFYIQAFPSLSPVFDVDYNIRLDVPEIRADGGEPNNSLAGALELGLLEGFDYHGATIHNTGDTDWYEFQIGARGGQQHFVALDLFHTFQTDLRLELYDAFGVPLGFSAGASNRHEISLANLPAGTYYAHVTGEHSGVTSPLYYISINAPLLSGVDSFETTNGPNNDHPLTATQLDDSSGFVQLGSDTGALPGQQTTGDFLSIHRNAGGAADIDYFRFELDQTGGPADFVQIDFDHDRGDLDLYLETYNSAFNFSSIVAASTGVGDGEAISLEGLPAGTYYAVVRGAFGATNPDYRLTLGAGGGLFPLDAFDRSQPNDNKNAATDLGPLSGVRLVPQQLSIHSSSDEDWYRFELDDAGGPRDGIAIGFDGDAGDIDVELYNATSGAPIAASRSLSDQEFISFDGLAAGTYFVRVFGYRGATNGRYDMTLVGPGEDIHDSSGMDNNTPEKATNLGTITGSYQEDFLSISQTDRDWFKFTTTATAGTGQSIAIVFDSDQDDLKFQLYDSTGQNLIAEAEGIGNLRSIDLTRLDFGAGPHSPLPAGTYMVRVEGDSFISSENSNYTLAITAPAENGIDRFDRDGASNNSRALATDLSSEEVAGPDSDGLIVFSDISDPLTVHSGDDDWYRLDLNGDERSDHFITVGFDHTQGDLDLELYYEDETTPRRVAEGIGNGHTIDLANLGDSGNYYLRVSGFLGAPNAAYTMLVSNPGPANTDWVDATASNDARASATQLGTTGGIITRDNLSLHADDEDWFEFTFASAPVKGHAISAAFDHFLGDVQLELYRDGEADPVRTSTTVEDIESIPLTGLGAGTYQLRVYGREVSTTNPLYSLIIDGPEGADGDRAEAGTGNDTAANAFDLRTVDGFSSFDPFSIQVSGDEDWYEFETAADAHAGNAIAVAFDSRLGDLDVFLYDQSGTTLFGSAETAQDVETIRFEDLASPLVAGTYKLLVRGHNGATNPRYIVSIDAPTDRLAPDAFEENDFSTNATNLGRVEGVLTLPGLSIDEPSDQDYFSFLTTEASNAGHSIQLLYDHEQGDLELAVLRPLIPGSVETVSQTDGDREVVSLEGDPDTIYNVIVRGVDGATNPNYTLVIDAPITPVADFVEDRTVLDLTTGHEIYDLRGITGALSLGGLSIHESGDVDRYLFRLEGGDPAPDDVIRVDTTRHDGPLTVRLQAFDTTLLAEVTQTTEDFVEIPMVGDSYAVERGQLYRVEVVAATPGGVNPDYTLTIAGRPEVVPDRYEGNETIAGAYVLGDVSSAASNSRLGELGIDIFPNGFLASPPFSPASPLNAPGSFSDGSFLLTGGETPSQIAAGQQFLSRFSDNTSLINHFTRQGIGSSFDLSGFLIRSNPTSSNSFSSSNTGTSFHIQQRLLELERLEAQRQQQQQFNRLLFQGLSSTRQQFNSIIQSSSGASLSRPASSPFSLFSSPSSFNTRPTFNQPTSGISLFGLGGSNLRTQSRPTSSGIDLFGTRHLARSVPQVGRVSLFGRSGGDEDGTGGLSIISDLSLTAGERDFFEFTLTHGAQPTDFVALSHIHEYGALTISLYAPDPEAGGLSTVIAASRGEQDLHRLSLAGLRAGTYHVAVEGRTPSVSNPNYALLFGVRAQDDQIGDLAEDNDTAITAHDLREIEGDQLLAGLSIHESGDDDWFRFEIPVGAVADGEPRVRIEFDHSLGDLDAELYAAGSLATPLAVSTSNQNFEELALTGFGGGLLSAGEYLVRVYGYEGATNPQYDLEISGVTAEIRPDFLEPDDEAATALEDFGAVNHIGGLTLTTEDTDRFEYTVPAGVTLTEAHAIVLEYDNPRYASSIVSLAGKTVGTHPITLTLPAGSPETRYTLHHNLPRTAEDAVNDWTVFVYLTASDLAEFAFDDINELEKAAATLPSGVSLVALWDQSQLGAQFATGGGDQAAWGGTGQAVIRPDTNPDIIQTHFDLSIGEQNTGDPETALVDFVEWGVSVAPAENYGLVMWNHGQGVEGFNFDNADGGPADAATAAELQAALADLSGQGIHFDLFAFDACNMAMLELTDAFGAYADVIVASQENVAGDGFVYDTMISPLLGNAETVTAEDLAAGIVESFEARYGGESRGADTLSAVTTTSLRSALTAFSSAALGAANTALFDTFRDARDAAASFVDHPEFRDLGQFAAFVAAELSVPSAVRSAASALAGAIEQSLVAKTSDARDTSGVSIYLPEHGSTLRAEYLLEFAGFLSATGWGDFLNEFVGGESVRPDSLEADWAEANEYAARAFDLHRLAGPNNVYTGLSLHNGVDRDWFRFETQGPGGAGDRVTVSRDAVDGPWRLELYAADGLTLVTSAIGSQNTLQTSLQGRPAGEYLVRVRGLGELTPRYELRIDAPSAVQSEDWAGENHTRGKAFDLGVVAKPTVFSGLVAGTQSDWFAFQTPRNERPAATSGNVLVRTNVGTDLFVSLRDEAGVTTLYEGTGSVRLPYDSSTAAAYDLSVSVDGGTAGYVLEFDPTPDPTILAGDYNADGVVDSGDYDVWRAAFGSTGLGLPADGNGDGRVNAADYTVWRNNVGAAAFATATAVHVEASAAFAFTADQESSRAANAPVVTSDVVAGVNSDAESSPSDLQADFWASLPALPRGSGALRDSARVSYNDESGPALANAPIAHEDLLLLAVDAAFAEERNALPDDLAFPASSSDDDQIGQTWRQVSAVALEVSETAAFSSVL